jgi:hypothetical protein
MDEQPNPQAPPPEADALAAAFAERDAAQAATAEARAAQAAAVAALRDTYRATNPTVPGDMIDGSTPEELAAALARGQAFRDQVLEAAKAAGANGHAVAPVVPSGAQSAPPPDYSAMSPMEKIRAGIARGN